MFYPSFFFRKETSQALKWTVSRPCGQDVVHPVSVSAVFLCLSNLMMLTLILVWALFFTHARFFY